MIQENRLEIRILLLVMNLLMSL